MPDSGRTARGARTKCCPALACALLVLIPSCRDCGTSSQLPESATGRPTLFGAQDEAFVSTHGHYFPGAFPSPSSLKSPLFSASFSVRVRLHRLTCSILPLSS